MADQQERIAIRALKPFVDTAWLDQVKEEALEPELPIVDCHHHFMDVSHQRTGLEYLLPELLEDLNAGHNIVATVFIEATTGYRSEGPEHLRPVGETEFATAIAEHHARTQASPAIAAGIIGRADLRLGAKVQEVLDAHVEAGHGRFKGVRANAIWVEGVNFGANEMPPGGMSSREFRAGFGRLAPMGLICDVVAFHPSLPELAELARAFPGTTIIVDHCGVPLGIGRYANCQAAVFRDWQSSIDALAKLPNVYMKLGGLGGPFYSPLVLKNLRARPLPPTSLEMAELLKPYLDVCINAFGPERCMFESNFPIDKYDCSYAVIWNAFKRFTKDFTSNEKNALYSENAKKIYKLKV